MKKTVCAILFLLGGLPFAAGYAMSHWMMAHEDTTTNLFLVGLIFLLAVMAVGFFANKSVGNPKHVVLSLMVIPAVVLALIGVQELVFHQYWTNAAGVATQLYYLPLIHMGFSLTFWTPAVFPAYLAAFLLMALAAWAGCSVQKGRRK